MRMIRRIDNRRLVIAHNPYSTKATLVQKQVFDRLDEAGQAYEKIEVRQAHLNDNVARLSPLIRPGDIILSAAGDGSAHAVFHAVMVAKQPGVELGFLAYGNFNDVPHTFNVGAGLRDPVAFLERAKPETVWPIDVVVDDAPLRSALLYATIGWTAQAARQFDDPRTRSHLTRGGGGLIKSLWRLGWYYVRSRRSSALPAFHYNGVKYKKTDLLFANGPTIARLFRSGKSYYQQNVFLFRMLDVRRLIPNVPFLVTGLFGRMKGEETAKVIIDFELPSAMTLQCDGEVVELNDASRIEVKKSPYPLVVLVSQ